jgi:hypothetical protein
MGRRFYHLAVADQDHQLHFTAATRRRRRSHAAGVRHGENQLVAKPVTSFLLLVFNQNLV